MLEESDRLHALRNHSYQDLIEFVESSLSLLGGLEEKRVIITYTKNSNGYSINEKSMLSMHLQEHMQRIEMELQVDEDNLGVLFFDPVSATKNEYFREIYHELFENGDYIENYGHIKDSLNIENSHHSVGIQIADYISGSFSALVKSGGKVNYQKGLSMFFQSIYPILRKGWNGQIQGYGIREVPRSSRVRSWMSEHINNMQNT